MADSTVTGLAATVGISDTNLMLLVDGGVATNVTMSQLTAYFEQRARQNNASVAAQSGFSTDTYLTGSNVTIPSGRLQAKSMYRCRFNVVKTAAGVAAPTLTVRSGTLGTTGDAPVGAVTFAAQTALTDEGLFEIFCVYRTSGASAVLQTVSHLSHRLTTTGLSVEDSPTKIATSAAFDSTSRTQIGMSVNGGTSASWTVSLVQAELFNLA